MDHTATPPVPDALSDTWAQACDIVHEAMQICGTPQHLANLLAERRADHRLRADIVRHAEQMMRRLIVIAAAAQVDTLPPVQPRKAQPTATRNTASSAHPETPPPSDVPKNEDRAPEPEIRDPFARAATPVADWSVSFSVLRQRPESRPRRPGPRERHRELWKKNKADLEAMGVRRPFIPPYEPPRIVSLLPLAARWEAVRRVAEAPGPFILRTARRIQRLRARNRIANAPIAFGTAPSRVRRSQGSRLFGALIHALAIPTATALRQIDSS